MTYSQILKKNGRNIIKILLLLEIILCFVNDLFYDYDKKLWKTEKIHTWGIYFWVNYVKVCYLKNIDFLRTFKK